MAPCCRLVGSSFHQVKLAPPLGDSLLPPAIQGSQLVALVHPPVDPLGLYPSIHFPEFQSGKSFPLVPKGLATEPAQALGLQSQRVVQAG